MSNFMTRGTTPSLQIRLPFDSKLIKEVKITFTQEKDNIILEKTLEDNENQIFLDGDMISVKLFQSDTLLFTYNKEVSFQVFLVLWDGSALATQIFTVEPLKIFSYLEVEDYDPEYIDSFDDSPTDVFTVVKSYDSRAGILDIKGAND